MKVLYCNPSFWDYRLPFYKKLNELFNGQFYVVYSTKRYVGREVLLNRIKNELGGNALPYDNELMFNWRKLTFNSVWTGIPLPFGIIKIIRKTKPDVLITEGFFQWTPFVLLYSVLFGIPTYMGYERTLWTERNNGKLKTWHRKITDKFIKGYLVNGSETKKYLMSIGINEEKIHIGGMCADGSGLREGIATMTDDERVNMSTKYKMNGGIMYLFCGALIERKGVEPLLSAWMEHIKVYPEDTLVLVGGGELYDKIISKYGDEHSIFIEGMKEYQAIYKYYGVADVFILPTIEDNWSLVVPEAMSCGLPVTTSVYNGCHVELIHEGKNGIVFDTYKQESILKALDYFHHVDLKAFGKNSIEIEKLFNTDNCAQRVYDALTK